MTSFQTPSTTTALREGESLRMAVAGGTEIVVTRGLVVLSEPPHWLGETMVAARTTLGEGGAHCVQQAGWIEISAQADAEVMQWTPESRWQAASAWLKEAARALRPAGRAAAAKTMP